MDIGRSYASLPPVIAPVAPIELKEPVQDVVEERPKSKILIVYSKDVSAEELALFKFHGRYLKWDDRYMNIALEKLPPHDYLFVDMRDRNARYALNAVNYVDYSVVCYVPFYHKGEKFIDQLSAIATTKFPLRAVSKEDFDRQLLNEKLQAPSLFRSFLGYFLSCVSA
jgi:hypothetical protein